MHLPLSFRRKALPILLGSLLASQGASAVVFDLYHQDNGYGSTGSELASALVTDSRISIVDGSSMFQGNTSGDEGYGGEGDGYGGEGDGYGGEVPLAFDVDIVDTQVVESGPTSGASASFFRDLDFGTAGGVHFTLPDGILLTSGNANPAEMNTQSGFTGFASGQGDAGLDLLLQAAGLDDVTSDATVLSFEFTVEGDANAVALDFIFGSEEYPEYVNSYPEIAGIFIDGVNYAAFGDGSLLTVTQNNVGAGNFVNNNGDFGDVDADGNPFPVAPEPLAIEYDGLSKPFTAVGNLDPMLQTHTIKIAVSDTNDTILDTAIFLANMRAITLGGGTVFDGPGSSPDLPLLPVPGDDAADGFDFQIFVGDAGIGTDPTQRIFFDPDVAVGYEFTSNIGVTSLQVTVDLGDGMYNLSVWDGMAYNFFTTFAVDEIVDLSGFNMGDGVMRFLIDGIETSAMVDPTDDTAFVYGLTFANAGQLNLNQLPITVFVDPNPGTPGGNGVPVPAGIYLLALGALVMRRRLFA